MTNEKSVYDLKDLSKKLKISVKTLRQYINDRKLGAKKIGRAYYITEASLNDFLKPNLDS